MAARVLLLTFIGTLLCFAVSLLFSLLGTVIVAAMYKAHPDMRVAYHIAVPIAAVAGSVIFLCAVIMELRHQRQARALRAIERIG